MSKINIKIIMPDRKKLDEMVNSVVLPGIDGDFEVLEGHSPFITRLRSGAIRILVDSKHEYYAIHEGFTSVENNKVLVLSEICENQEEIDIKRAEKAKERAEQRFSKADPGTVDFRRAEVALKRAITRLETKKIHI